MRDADKTKEQLLREMEEIRQRLAELEAPEAERQQAEKALRESEEKYRALLELGGGIGEAIIMLQDNEQGNAIHTFASNEWPNITGYSRKELLGMSFFDLLHPKHHEASMKRHKRKMSGETIPKLFEMSIIRKDGTEVPIEITSAYTTYKGEHANVVFIRDITERKQAEERIDHLNLILRAIRNINQLIARERDHHQLLKGICRNLTTPRGYHHTWIALLDESGKLVTHAEAGLGKDFLPVVERLKLGELPPCARQALEQSAVVVTEDPASTCTDCPLSHTCTAGIRALVIRLEYKERVYGLWSASIPTAFITDEEVTLFQDVASDIAFALHDIELEEARQQAEEALRESEEKSYKAFHSSPQAIAITTLEDGRFIEVNDSHSRITGYTRKELIGRTTAEFNTWVNPKDRRRIVKILKEKGHVDNEEIQFRIKSGETYTGLFSAELISIGGEQCIISSSTDITERKKAEEALRESEEKFSKAFRASPEIITISRLSDGTFLEVNNSFTRITGYTREEIIGHSSLELGIWVNPSERRRMLKLLKEKGRVSNKEYSLRTKSGEIRTMLFSAEQITLGHEVCLLAVTIDITEFRKMEEQAREAENLRELDRLRTELLANISHELRTPLASIKGFATMLLDYDRRLKRDEKREYLETIDKNTDRLVELIEQLLEMSRLEAGMLSITKKPTSISRLCRDVIAEASVRSSTHQFTLDIPAKFPRVNVDGRRIRQVLDNIIDNSVKYSDAGTEVNLAVRRKGPELLFTVTDHGIGIPRNDLPRVFNRMFHSPKKSGIAGAGLGLSICKGLVEAHGGRIWIESDEGKVTRCFFTLPLDTERGGRHDKKA